MKLWILHSDKKRYSGMEKYPDTIIVFGNEEQAELIADDISNNQAGCTGLFYIAGEITI